MLKLRKAVSTGINCEVDKQKLEKLRQCQAWLKYTIRAMEKIQKRKWNL